MNHTTTMQIEFIRATCAALAAIAIGFTDAMLPDLGGVVSVIDRLGLPVACLVAVGYALVSTNKALRNSEAGRLADRDDFMKQIRHDSERAERSRESLKDALDRLTDEIRRRP